MINVNLTQGLTGQLLLVSKANAEPWAELLWKMSGNAFQAPSPPTHTLIASKMTFWMMKAFLYFLFYRCCWSQRGFEESFTPRAKRMDVYPLISSHEREALGTKLEDVVSFLEELRVDEKSMEKLLNLRRPAPVIRAKSVRVPGEDWRPVCMFALSAGTGRLAPEHPLGIEHCPQVTRQPPKMSLLVLSSTVSL